MNDDLWVTKAAWACYFAVLSACVLSTWPTWREDLGMWRTDQGLAAWVQAIGSVLAILVAIWVSQRQHRNDLERERLSALEREVALCNRTMLVLSRQYAYLVNVSAQAFRPFEHSPARHIEVRPDLRHDAADRLDIDASSLAFISMRGAPQLPVELARVEDYFRLFVAVFNTRSQVHSERLQPKLDAAGLTDLTAKSLHEVERIAGPHIVGDLKTLTDEAYSIHARAMELYEHAFVDAPKQFRSIYPGYKFLSPVK